MRPVIHSTKHYVQMSLTTAATATVVDTELVLGVPIANKNLVFEVEEGASVKAIYIELWLEGATINQFFTVILAKYPSGIGAASLAEMAALGNWDNKKNILYTTQGLASNDGVSGPIPVMRQWFKIPKGKQRMGINDRIRIQVASRGDDDIKFCGFATYKEYT